MVFRERKLTFKRILSWFTLEIASCQLFGSGRLAKINFWFGNFTKSVILYLIKYCIFANQKRMCIIRMKRKIKTNNQYGEILEIYVLHRIHNHFPDVLSLQRLFVDLFQKHKICEPIKVCQITRSEYIIVFASIVTWNINIASHL